MVVYYSRSNIAEWHIYTVATVASIVVRTTAQNIMSLLSDGNSRPSVRSSAPHVVKGCTLEFTIPVKISTRVIILREHTCTWRSMMRFNGLPSDSHVDLYIHFTLCKSFKPSAYYRSKLQPTITSIVVKG